jgi:hypothetical protein
LSIYLSLYLFVDVFVSLSVCLSISLCLFVCHGVSLCESQSQSLLMIAPFSSMVTTYDILSREYMYDGIRGVQRSVKQSRAEQCSVVQCSAV